MFGFNGRRATHPLLLLRVSIPAPFSKTPSDLRHRNAPKEPLNFRARDLVRSGAEFAAVAVAFAAAMTRAGFRCFRLSSVGAHALREGRRPRDVALQSVEAFHQFAQELLRDLDTRRVTRHEAEVRAARMPRGPRLLRGSPGRFEWETSGGPTQVGQETGGRGKT